MCVLPAGMGPAVLEKWQPQRTTLTAQSELLSMPRSEVRETDLGGWTTLSELETGLCWQSSVQLLSKMTIFMCVIRYSSGLLKQYPYRGASTDISCFKTGMKNMSSHEDGVVDICAELYNGCLGRKELII